MHIVIPLTLIAGGLLGISRIVWPKLKLIKESAKAKEVNKDFWYLMFPELLEFSDSAVSRLKILKENILLDYEKFLRRVKILSLKTDNMANRLLEKRPKAKLEGQFIEPVKNNGQDSAQFKSKEGQLISEISKNPKDKNLYKVLGAFYLDSGMTDDAREAFSVVLELDPGDSEARDGIEKIGKI